MKRELKLIENSSKNKNADFQADQTSSLCTDSSMVDISIETERPKPQIIESPKNKTRNHHPSMNYKNDNRLNNSSEEKKI